MRNIESYLNIKDLGLLSLFNVRAAIRPVKYLEIRAECVINATKHHDLYFNLTEKSSSCWSKLLNNNMYVTYCRKAKRSLWFWRKWQEVNCFTIRRTVKCFTSTMKWHKAFYRHIYLIVSIKLDIRNVSVCIKMVYIKRKKNSWEGMMQ